MRDTDMNAESPLCATVRGVGEFLHQASPVLIDLALLFAWVNFIAPSIASWYINSTKVEFAYTVEWGVVLALLMRLIHRACRVVIVANRRPIDVGANIIRPHSGDPATLLRRAQHEAAHAVAVHITGHTPTSIDLHVRGNAGGSCTFDQRGADSVADVLFDSAVIGLTPHTYRPVSGLDCYADLQDVARYTTAVVASGQRPTHFTGPLTVETVLAAARSRAELIVNEYGDLIEYVAQAVLSTPRKALYGSDLRTALTGYRAPKLEDSHA